MEYGMSDLDQDCVGHLCEMIMVQKVSCHFTDGCLPYPDCGLQSRLPQGPAHKPLYASHH